MTDDNMPREFPRAVPEGAVPLLSVQGSAYDCGRQYAELVAELYPGHRRYLDALDDQLHMAPDVAKLFSDLAPHLEDVYRGMRDAAGPSQGQSDDEAPAGCTSFGVSGQVTLDGAPISGQSKDTSAAKAMQYIVLRMRIAAAPTILTLAYPGEVLGYGMWTTGTSLFRNSLYSTAAAETGLPMSQWGVLALAGESVGQAAELATRFGIRGSGNCLISDSAGRSVSVEFNAGGVSLLPARDGVCTHANHAEGENTSPFARDRGEPLNSNSLYRMHGFYDLLAAERGRITPQRALMCLADHTQYPRGLCRHIIGDNRDRGTSAVIIAEPTRGKVHVVRGNPCCNWPVTYTV